jgi:glycine C-acetyltransferase
MRNILALRAKLRDAGMDYYGDPSAIVAVKMGNEGLARLASRRLPELGLMANLVEYPAVAKGAARFRMQVMAGHTDQNIAQAVERLGRAVVAAKAELDPASAVAPLSVAA